MNSFDFLMPSFRCTKTCTEIYPRFKIVKSSDMMIRGGDFYAIWDEDRGLWSEDEQDAVRLIDREIDIYADQYKKEHPEEPVRVLHMWDADTGMIDKWHKYVKVQSRENFSPLDEKLIFSNDPVNKDDFASKRLPYPLEKAETPAYDKLVGTLYSPEERAKIEWAIGAIVSGDSKKIQKFIVLYGPIGTGKSTVIEIMEWLFDGYYAAFDAKTLGSSSNAFALEAFRSNPLVAIQHDGDLSHIEDNTRINSLVSHEKMTVNEKFKSAYSYKFNTFLVMGTNKPVKITDAKSGIIRRLIDITPTGDKLPRKEYDICKKQIRFELGGIAYKCLEFYKSDPDRYADYIPMSMLEASNDFYNFMLDNYHIFKKEDGVSQKAAWAMYQHYCEEAKVLYPMGKRVFKEELKSYFKEFLERFQCEDGTRVRSYYKGFRSEKFDGEMGEKEEEKAEPWLIFDKTESLIDKEYADCPAQEARDDKPVQKWETVTTKLSDISTGETHFVKPPEGHIVIDFDIPDENGNKSLEKNLEEALKWPKTYAELSKSGQGIHLHYIYTGDVSRLSRVYKEHIEIKTFTGGSSLRRKLTLCNDIPIATLSSGLPLREEKKMVDFEAIKNEKMLRALVRKNLNKEIMPATKPSIDLIVKDLDSAYRSGIVYDISDMRPAIFKFAASSTHQADYCLKQIPKMKFASEKEPEPAEEKEEASLIFFDWEVYPNKNCVCWKLPGNNPVNCLTNPTPAQIEELMKFRMVGFNCRRYDNHITYGALMGYSPEQLYALSQKIINEGTGFFREAYNISYTDIYDFSSKKQGLKKFEIELGIHHQEMGIPWDKPVPDDEWETVLEYCKNDVIATEAVWDARHADFVAREVLADVAGLTVNDTTNTLTTMIIFGKDRKPQGRFNYRNMGDISVPHTEPDILNGFDEYTVFDEKGRPIFPGYVYDHGVSTYRGEEVGEGGYVYTEPGIYQNVALLDIASMHPSSIVAEELFGSEYTKRFKEIMDARIAIKHKDFDKARTMLGGSLAKYLDDESAAKDLAQALKIAINSVYGLTSASFDNPFRDNRNIDNIVAKRGALFMINLKHEVQKRGFTVAHIKTDSIKIPNATNDIIKFVYDYGKKYGYTFEHEATYDRMCLVNKAVYVARYADAGKCEAYYGYVPDKNQSKALKWTATGTKFQVPYVFKTLFSKENLIFSDTCETKSVSTGMYLDMNEDLPEGKHLYIFVGKVGSFCPIKPGCKGGILVREGDGKYDAVAGTKGYRWLEAEEVKKLGLEKDIDISYYKKLADDAMDSIREYGDPEWFLSDISPDFPPDDDLPF